MLLHVAHLHIIGKYRLKVLLLSSSTFMISDFNQGSCLQISLFSTFWNPPFKNIFLDSCQLNASFILQGFFWQHLWETYVSNFSYCFLLHMLLVPFLGGRNHLDWICAWLRSWSVLVESGFPERKEKENFFTTDFSRSDLETAPNPFLPVTLICKL